jgi:hypothetical protein
MAMAKANDQSSIKNKTGILSCFVGLSSYFNYCCYYSSGKIARLRLANAFTTFIFTHPE